MPDPDQIYHGPHGPLLKPLNPNAPAPTRQLMRPRISHRSAGEAHTLLEQHRWIATCEQGPS